MIRCASALVISTLFGLLGRVLAACVPCSGQMPPPCPWCTSIGCAWLTSLSVSVFFVHSPPVLLHSTAGAAASTLLFGAMKGAAALTLGVPVCTLPFCAVASGCYAAGWVVPGLRHAAAPHSPEVNA